MLRICQVIGCSLLFFWLVLAGLTGSKPAYAQAPDIAVTDVDASAYPLIHVTVSVTDGAALLHSLVVMEAGVPITPEAVILHPNYEIAILADFWSAPALYPSLNQGLARAVDTIGTARWSRYDKLALLTPVAGGRVEELVALRSNNRNEVINALYTYAPPTDLPTTPLLDLTIDALRRFSGSTSAQRVLLVISDGFDNQSQGTLDDLQRAIPQGVRIYTVNCTPGALNPQIQLLEDIAAVGNGLKLDYYNEQSLHKLWNALFTAKRTVTFDYQTTQTLPYSITVAMAQEDGQWLQSEAAQVDLSRLRVAFISPQPNALITITKNVSNEVISVDPQPQATIRTSWTGSAIREIQGVEYYLDSKPFATEREIINPFNIPVDDLSAGEHTLQVQVHETIPELTASAIVTLQVKLEQEEALPLPEPPKELTWQEKLAAWWQAAWADAQQHLLLWVPDILLSLIALWFALWAWRRARRRPLINTTPATTVQPILPMRPLPQQGVRAELLLRQGADCWLPFSIPLYELRTVLGSNPTNVGADLNSRVELLGSSSLDPIQCIIEYQPDEDAFLLRSVATQTNTVVNGRQLLPDNQGLRLTSGAVIEMGRIKYVFMPTPGSLLFDAKKDKTGEYTVVTAKAPR